MTRPSSCRTSRGSAGRSSSPATSRASSPPPSRRPGTIAAVGGTASVPAVPNYIVGYINGAKSVKPDIKIGHPVRLGGPRQGSLRRSRRAARRSPSRCCPTNKSIDVIFQVAGLTGNGVLQAACEANIVAIGVDVDQFVSAPETAQVHRRERREEAQEERLGRDRARQGQDGQGRQRSSSTSRPTTSACRRSTTSTA